MQAYIKNNPHTIPIDEIKEDLRLLVLAREFPTGSGPIDALGVDRDGNIYVIETKLAKNPDKRYVLAQMLDYGAALWRTYESGDEFVERLERSVAENFRSTLGDKIGDFFGKEVEDVTALIQTVRQNLSAGNFRFIVLMDRLEDRLKNLITFVNRNSQFTDCRIAVETAAKDLFGTSSTEANAVGPAFDDSQTAKAGSRSDDDRQNVCRMDRQQAGADVPDPWRSQCHGDRHARRKIHGRAHRGETRREHVRVHVQRL